jgi:hypothetical protein
MWAYADGDLSHFNNQIKNSFVFCEERSKMGGKPLEKPNEVVRELL